MSATDSQARVVPLEYRGVRCVAKRMRGDDAEQVARTLAWIAAHTPAHATLRVPRVVHVDRDAGRLVVEELPGQSLAAALATDGRAAVRRVAAALAELHAVPIGPLRPRTARDHVTEIVSPAPSQLAAALPRWCPTIERAVELIVRIDSGASEVTPLHRDFHVRQIVLGEHVGVVDWDDAAAGDPLFDVAYFTTYLETHSLDPDGALRAAFQAAYSSDTGRVLDMERMAGYRVFNLLRRAARRHRLVDAGWRSERDQMLTLLDEALAEEPAR